MKGTRRIEIHCDDNDDENAVPIVPNIADEIMEQEELQLESLERIEELKVHHKEFQQKFDKDGNFN